MRMQFMTYIVHNGKIFNIPKNAQHITITEDCNHHSVSWLEPMEEDEIKPRYLNFCGTIIDLNVVDQFLKEQGVVSYPDDGEFVQICKDDVMVDK